MRPCLAALFVFVLKHFSRARVGETQHDNDCRRQGAQGAARKPELKAVGRTERAHKPEAEAFLFSRTAAGFMARFASGASSAASSAHALPICMSCAGLIYTTKVPPELPP